MRLWSIHPRYLDSKGLVALWREGPLAQKVLAGETRGYRNHPQLERFRSSNNPLGAVASYLRAVAAEADARNYKFDKTKIARRSLRGKLTVTDGQLSYERAHLGEKLKTRAPERLANLFSEEDIEVHPLLYVIQGDIEPWEVI